MSRLPQKAPGTKKRATEVDNNIPAYHTAGQISEPNKVSSVNGDEIGTVAAPEKLLKAQASGVLCQSFREELTEDGTIIVDNELLCKEVCTDGAVQIIVP